MSLLGVANSIGESPFKKELIMRLLVLSMPRMRESSSKIKLDSLRGKLFLSKKGDNGSLISMLIWSSDSFWFCWLKTKYSELSKLKRKRSIEPLFGLLMRIGSFEAAFDVVVLIKANARKKF